MSETNEAIASLRSSVDVVHAMLARLQAQAADLASRVESLTALIQSEVAARVAADFALGGKVDALQAQIDNLQSKVYSGS
ncbi:hypothetical protein L1F19_10455 [Pseudomonas juntendi]|uniref:hypothetical protein n=1 Tax=Pseudomonas juntendi TaxID=2666183 RepID=UPI001F3DF708|nr:hypothetical protein [Pseudomonas juntendi]MCF3156629.1 hypothetical protein [Pseudomonas juntendi]